MTGWRSTTPGALNSIGRRSLVAIGPLPVDRLTQRIDDATDERLTDRNARHLAGALDRASLGDLLPRAEQRHADVVGLEIEREPDHAVVELEHLHREAVLEAIDACDAVADLEDRADLGEIGLDVVLLDPLLQNRGDLFGA